MTKISNRKILKFCKLLIVIVPIIILFFVINKRFVPFGVLSETYPEKKNPVIISKLVPPQNVDDLEKNFKTKKTYQRIIKDHAYFNVNLPFNAKKVEVEMEYQNPEAPIVQLGVQKELNQTEQFLIEPLENRILENINTNDWFRIDDQENQVIFLQKLPDLPKDSEEMNNNGQEEQNNQDGVDEKDKEEKSKKGEPLYKSFDEFIYNIPTDKVIALYQYDLYQNYGIKDYTPSLELFTFNKTIRGSHNIITYIENENLDFTFNCQKRSESKKPLSVKINVSHGNEEVAEFSNEDSLEQAQIHVFIPNARRGLYGLAIEADSNTQISEIRTYQKLFAFKDKIVLDNADQSTQFRINSFMLSFKTDHEEGKQTITLNGKNLRINELHRYFSLPDYKNLYKEVTIPKGDLSIEYNGLASIQREGVDELNPLPINSVSLENYPNIDNQPFDFIIAKLYAPAQTQEDGWKIAKRTFYTDDVLVADGKIKFLISIPGLQNYENVKISRIKVTLRK